MIKRKMIEKSSQIQEVAHDSGSKTLYIRFHRSDWYSYDNVPDDVYEGLVGDKSPGSYLHRNIKGKYEYNKCLGLTPWVK